MTRRGSHPPAGSHGRRSPLTRKGAPCFDLTPVKERFQAAYGQDSGTVLLLLQPLPLADDPPLVYQF